MEDLTGERDQLLHEVRKRDDAVARLHEQLGSARRSIDSLGSSAAAGGAGGDSTGALQARVSELEHERTVRLARADPSWRCSLGQYECPSARLVR